MILLYTICSIIMVHILACVQQEVRQLIINYPSKAKVVIDSHILKFTININCARTWQEHCEIGYSPVTPFRDDYVLMHFKISSLFCTDQVSWRDLGYITYYRDYGRLTSTSHFDALCAYS